MLVSLFSLAFDPCFPLSFLSISLGFPCQTELRDRQREIDSTRRELDAERRRREQVEASLSAAESEVRSLRAASAFVSSSVAGAAVSAAPPAPPSPVASALKSKQKQASEAAISASTAVPESEEIESARGGIRISIRFSRLFVYVGLSL